MMRQGSRRHRPHHPALRPSRSRCSYGITMLPANRVLPTRHLCARRRIQREVDIEDVHPRLAKQAEKAAREWLVHDCPHRPDIVDRAPRLAGPPNAALDIAVDQDRLLILPLMVTTAARPKTLTSWDVP